MLIGHTPHIFRITLTRDDKHIVSGSWDRTVRLWNLEESTQEAVLLGHTGVILDIFITTDSKCIISGGSGDFTTRAWS